MKNQLISEHRSDRDSEISGLTTTNYAYDANGNLITKTVGATIYQWTYYDERDTSHRLGLAI